MSIELLRKSLSAERASFVEPCLPSPADKPPSGSNWIHEIKHDGLRLMAPSRFANFGSWWRDELDDLNSQSGFAMFTYGRLCTCDGGRCHTDVAELSHQSASSGRADVRGGHGRLRQG
jgi:hypothetical protein